MRVDILNNELFRKSLNQVSTELQIPNFAGITIDSRKVQKGDIFLALKGEALMAIIILIRQSMQEHLLRL